MLSTQKTYLYWMDKENFLKAVKNEKDTTIENKWTNDGVKDYSYGSSFRGSDNEEIERKLTLNQELVFIGLYSKTL